LQKGTYNFYDVSLIDPLINIFFIKWTKNATLSDNSSRCEHYRAGGKLETLSTHMPDLSRLRLILWQHSNANMIAK